MTTAIDRTDVPPGLFRGILNASAGRRPDGSPDVAIEALVARLAQIDELGARGVKFSAINRCAVKGEWLLAEVSPGPGAPWWHVVVVECGTGMVAYTRRAVHRDAVELHLIKERVAAPEFGERPAVEREANPYHHEPADHEPHTDTRDVYFIQAVGGGLVKIGVAGSPSARLASIQFMSPLPLRLLGVLPGVGQVEETRLHARFAAIREHGEWFQPTSALMAYIDENAVAV